MIDSTDLFAVGPDINPQLSEDVQQAVMQRVIDQAEEVVLASAGELPDPGNTFAGVMALRSLAPDQQRRIAQHPSFRYWLQAMRRTSDARNPVRQAYFASRLPDFIWAEQAISGQFSHTWVVSTDERGGLRCPSRGRYIELGDHYTNQIVQISLTENGPRLRCADGLTIHIPPEDLIGPPLEPLPTLEEHGYRLRIEPTLAEGRIVVSTRDPWLRVKLTGTNQRADGVDFFDHDDAMYEDQPPLGNLREALQHIATFWPEGHEDFARFTCVVVPINLGEHTYRAFTVSTHQGAIFIGDAPPDPTIEMLLHENAHVKLRQLQALDPLLMNPLDESVRIPVPWRPDPRPIPGIFEGLFVFTHVAEFEWRRLQHEPSPKNSAQLVRRIQDLENTVTILQQHAQFTEHGAHFFAAMQQWVSDLSNRANLL